MQAITRDEIRVRFREVAVAETLPDPSWNIAPTQNIAILLETRGDTGGESRRRRAESARWSLTPPWSPTLSTSYPTFNARSEEIATKPTWARPLATRRCLIVTTGFYEWSGPKHARVPHFITTPHGAEDEPLLIAGLYGWWREPNSRGSSGWHLTATMLTREATGVVAEIHHRAPVFMHPHGIQPPLTGSSLTEQWLDPGLRGTQALADAVSHASLGIAADLTMRRVEPLRGDGPHLTDPVQPRVSVQEGIFEV